MKQEFISESLEPIGSFDLKAMSEGEPGLPTGFRWRGHDWPIKQVLSSKRGMGSDRTHGSSEQYVQKHWYELEMEDGSRWSVYFDRQSRGAKQSSDRWRLYAVDK